MSLDFQLAHSCPHLVLEEYLDLSDDRRSLIAKAPIGNTTLIRVLANNQYYIPSSGLYSQATLKSSKSGPFMVTGCITADNTQVSPNNVFTISSSRESQTYQLPLGNRIPTDDLVRLFKRNLTTVLVANEKGYLVFTDIGSVGLESIVRVSGRGAEALGFVSQYQARGQEVYPPWGLVTREDILPAVNRQGQVITTARYVRFNKPLRSNPAFKVSYISAPERCPRCQGTYIENDWRFNIQGQLVAVDKENLLYQACMKMLLTVKGSNPFHTNYGSSLMNRIGSKVLGATTTLIQEDVQLALNRVQTLQRQQAQFQTVSLKERLYSVLAVEVQQNQNDPTAFLVEVVVSNGSGQPIQLSIVFSVPGAIALAGTNNLSLGV